MTVKHLLPRNKSQWKAAQTLASWLTLQIADFILSTTGGRAIRLQWLTAPMVEQNQILPLLDLNLPNQFDSNQEYNGRSKTA